MFIRSSRGVKLTYEGQLLYKYTKEAFEILKKGEDLMMHMKEKRSGPSKNRCQLYPMQIYPAALPKPLFKGISPYKDNNRKSIHHTHPKTTGKGTLDIGLVAKPANQKLYKFLPVDEIEDIFVATKDYFL